MVVGLCVCVGGRHRAVRASAMAVCVRFDYYGRQYVAGILEEDDLSHAGREVIGRAVNGDGSSLQLARSECVKQLGNSGLVGGGWLRSEME